jgi:RimJ/RimL family protein N-acetyltransferase
MYLRPVEQADVPCVAEWLAEKATSQWLDFGNGQQSLSAGAITIMRQRDVHRLRMIVAGSVHVPVGLVVLSNLVPAFRTATIWYVLGDPAWRGRGYATRAVSEMLTYGFGPLRLHAINAWAVEANHASLRVLERNHFRVIGRQRECHWIDGRVYDRVWFDLLASEHEAARERESEGVGQVSSGV